MTMAEGVGAEAAEVREHFARLASTASRKNPLIGNLPGLIAAEAAGVPTLSFDLPGELEAGEPPEARGLARDEVRLMVSSLADDSVRHARFRDLPGFLRAGDVLVLNTSGTLNAALAAQRMLDDAELELHLSTHLPDGEWVVELRRPDPAGTLPFYTAAAGETFGLPGGGSASLLRAYQTPGSGRVRLWVASLDLPEDLRPYLARHGFPIRYSYVRQAWPAEYYQTVYATEPGSAEMPSAGRAFTPQLLARLAAQGVQLAPLLLHTGVASLEDHEPPYAEYYRVPDRTAGMVNWAREHGRRVIAVGTTAVRALESAADAGGRVRAAEGWTELIITPERGLRAVSGLLTGLHEPRASHLAMLAALAGFDHLRLAYAEALAERYLWHEFGDLHLILPEN